MRMAKVTLGIMVALGLGACGGGGERAIIGSSGARTSTSEAPTTVLVPTTVAGPVSSSTTVRLPTAPVTTVLRTTTTRPQASTTTTAPGLPLCSAVQLTVDVTTDKATYRPGELVRALATLRNRSSAPCVANGYSGSSRFSGPAGTPVGYAGMLIGEGGPFGLTTLGPGETMTQDPTFDQRICSDGVNCTQAPPGTYAVTVDWTFSGPPIVGSKTFVLVGA